MSQQKKVVNVKQKLTSKNHIDGVLILDSFCFRKWKETILLRAAKLYYRRFLENKDHKEWSDKQVKNEMEVEYNEGLNLILANPVDAMYTELIKAAEVAEY